MNMNRIFGIILLLTAFCGLGIAQSPTPTPSPAAAKLSEALAKRLETFDPTAELPRADREQAYAKLMQAQRYIWQAARIRGQVAIATNLKLARVDLQKSLELNP